MAETLPKLSPLSEKPVKKVVKAKEKSFRFIIKLSNSQEVDFQALVAAKQHKRALRKKKPKTSTNVDSGPKNNPLQQDNLDNPSELAASSAIILPGEKERGSSSPKQDLNKASRYNIIERLEKRYGIGGMLTDFNMDAQTICQKTFSRQEEDDLYDSDDSFIDDSTLYQTIEKKHEGNLVKTTHTGFFVNEGSQIETFYDKQASEKVDMPLTKKRKSLSGDYDTSLELADAALDWQPGPKIENELRKLEAAAIELFKDSPPKKFFPRKLDSFLHAVDKEVVSSHPNKWRSKGYFARLMQFLPFTKASLKASMLRLEAKGVALDAKKEVSICFDELTKRILALSELGVYIVNPENSQVIGKKLYEVLSKLDEWVTKESEYRLLLKAVDKKNIPNVDTLPLNSRQERNKMYNKILAAFPKDSVEISYLRNLYKVNRGKQKKRDLSKVKTPNKNSNSKKSVNGSGSSAKKLSPAPSPSKDSSGSAVKKKKINSMASPATTKPTPRKNPCCRSRMFEICPAFLDMHFQEK